MRARWVILIAGMLLGALGGAAYTGSTAIEHRSTAIVYFAVDRAKTASDYTAGNTFAQSVMPSFTQIVKSPIVLDPVIKELDLKTTAGSLAGRIQVDVPANTAVMKVTVTDTTSLRAAMTANAVIRRLDEAVHTLSPRGDQDTPAMRMSSVSAAVATDKKSTVNRPMYVALGVVGGLLAALAIVAIWESLTRPIRSSSDVEEVSAAPVLARIAVDGQRVEAPARGGAAGTLGLHTNIAAVCEKLGGVKTVAVVPVTVSGDARAVAIDLAIVGARAQNRILLVDADLRSASVAGILGAESTPGLSEILQNTTGFAQALQRMDGLDFLAAGSAGGNAAELLLSPRLKPFLEIESARYQTLLAVGGAVLPAADGAMLSAGVGATVLVARRGYTKRRDLADAVDRLTAAGGTLAGVVLVHRRSAVGRVLSRRKNRAQESGR